MSMNIHSISNASLFTSLCTSYLFLLLLTTCTCGCVRLLVILIILLLFIFAEPNARAAEKIDQTPDTIVVDSASHRSRLECVAYLFLR